jgi:hypothetical protein
MPRWRFHRYLAWLGASWDLGQTEDAQQVAFAYTRLRQATDHAILEAAR